MPLWLEVLIGAATVVGVTAGLGMALGYLSYLVTRSQVLEGTRELTRKVDELEKSREDLEKTMRQDIIPFIEQLKNQPPNPLTGLQQIRKNQLLETLEERRLSPPRSI